MKWSICSHFFVQFTIWRRDLISLEALSRFFCVLFFCRVLFSILRPRIVFSAEGETLPLHRISQDFSATLSANLRLKLSTTTTFFFTSNSASFFSQAIFYRLRLWSFEQRKNEEAKTTTSSLHSREFFLFLSCAIEKRKYFTWLRRCRFKPPVSLFVSHFYCVYVSHNKSTKPVIAFCNERWVLLLPFVCSILMKLWNGCWEIVSNVQRIFQETEMRLIWKLIIQISRINCVCFMQSIRIRSSVLVARVNLAQITTIIWLEIWRNILH